MLVVCQKCQESQGCGLLGVAILATVVLSLCQSVKSHSGSVVTFGRASCTSVSKVSRVTGIGRVPGREAQYCPSLLDLPLVLVQEVGVLEKGRQRRSSMEVMRELLRRCREKMSSKKVMRVVLKRCCERGAVIVFDSLCSWVVCAWTCKLIRVHSSHQVFPFSVVFSCPQ